MPPLIIRTQTMLTLDSSPWHIRSVLSTQGPVCTLLLPCDEAGTLGHEAVQIRPPQQGLRAGALLRHIHAHYAACLPADEALHAMQQHPRIRRALQVSV